MNFNVHHLIGVVIPFAERYYKLIFGDHEKSSFLYFKVPIHRILSQYLKPVPSYGPKPDL